MYLDVLFLTAATGLMALCQWLLISYTARTWGIGISGEYAFALSVMTPLFLLIYQSYRTIMITKEDGENHEQDKEYFRFRFIINFICAVFLFVLIVINPFGYDDRRYEIMLVIFLIKSIEGFSDLSYGVFQKRKNGKLQSISIIFRCLLGFFVFWGLSTVFKDFIISCLGVALSWFVVFTFFDKKKMNIDFMVKDLFPQKKDFLRIYKNFKIAMPLIFSSFAGALVYNSPRYSIDQNLGVNELGYYSILTSFSVAVNLGCAAMGQALMPWLVSVRKNKKTFYKISGFAVAFCMVISLLIIFASWLYGHEILVLLFGVSDPIRERQFLWLMILMIPLYLGQILSFVNNSTGYFKSTFYITLLLIIFVFIATDHFIVEYHLYGAGLIMSFIGSIQVIGYSIGIWYGLERANVEKT